MLETKPHRPRLLIIQHEKDMYFLIVKLQPFQKKRFLSFNFSHVAQASLIFYGLMKVTIDNNLKHNYYINVVVFLPFL